MRSGGDVRPLAPADAFFLYAESWRAPQTVVAACHTSPSMNRDGLIRHLAAQLDAAPWLRRTLVRRAWGLRRPGWRTLPDVDLAEHVHEATIPAPGGLAGLAAFAGAVAGWRFPRDRPLWRMWVLPGLDADHAAYVIAVHHAVCDGPALVELFGPLFITTDRQVPRPTPSPAGTRVAKEPRNPWAAARRVAWGIALLAADGMVRAGPFTRRLRPARRLALASVPLSTVRAAARAGGAQPTDVVLAALAGAIQRTQPPPRGRGRPIRVVVPVLARAGATATATGNRTAGLWVHLPVDEPDPVRRVQQVAADRTRRSTSARALATRFVMERIGGLLPAPVHALAVRGAYRGRFFHAIVSVMPGPRRTPYLGPGEIITAHPVLPLADRVGLGLGGLVWGDALCLGLVGDGAAVPDPDALLAEVVADIERLAATAAPARHARRRALDGTGSPASRRLTYP